MTKSVKLQDRSPPESAAEQARAALVANPVLGPQSSHFWQAQDRFLDEAQEFTTAWFRRRHDATQSAIDAASKIASGGLSDPAVVMEVMADWQKQAMGRVAQDAMDCSKMMTRCVSSFASHRIEAAEEIAENTKTATSGRYAIPV